MKDKIIAIIKHIRRCSTQNCFSCNRYADEILSLEVNTAIETAFEKVANATDGSQIINGEWYIPKFGCDTMQVFIDSLKGKAVKK